MSKSSPKVKTPKLDILKNAVNEFYAATGEIQKIRDSAQENKKQLDALSADLKTPSSELKVKARAVRNEMEDSEFEIAALEKRLPALAQALNDLERDASYEHRSTEQSFNNWRQDETAKLLKDPALIEGVRLLKLLATLSTNQRSVIESLDLINLEENEYFDVATEAGYRLDTPSEPSTIERAKRIYRLSQKPDTVHMTSQTGPKLKWHQVA